MSTESGPDSDAQMFEFDTFTLDITWDRPDGNAPAPPNLVGPFPTREAADGWASLNVPNGSWEVRPLAWPHYVSPTVAFRRGLQAARIAVADLCHEPR